LFSKRSEVLVFSPFSVFIVVRNFKIIYYFMFYFHIYLLMYKNRKIFVAVGDD